MLKQRVITGVCIAVIVCSILAFSHISLVIQGFVALLSVIAVYELFDVSGMLKKKSFPIVFWLIAEIFAVIFPFLSISFHSGLLLAVFTGAVLAGGWNMLRFDKYQLKKSGILFLISLSFPVLYSSLIYARMQDNGLVYVILMILSCFATDTGAYFVGRACGKHKLAPVLSPKKTIEGFIGGVGINIVIYVLIGLILQFGFGKLVNLWIMILLGVCCGVLDQFGDLALSSIKRNLQVKDFGKLMPGHGGVLDRFDSLLYVGAFVYLFIMWIHPLYI